jgi:hypothetical protein
MAHTTLNVSTHITRLCPLILISVSTTPMIGSGTGFCAEDSDGKIRLLVPCLNFRRLTVFVLLGGKMEHLLHKKQSSLGRYRILTGQGSVLSGSPRRMAIPMVLILALHITPPMPTLVAGLGSLIRLASSSFPARTIHGEPVRSSLP